METLKISLIASLIATAAGFSAWEFGLARRIWPTHPQMADFLFVLITAIAVQIAWPRLHSGQGNQS
jgi:hypothetical protein